MNLLSVRNLRTHFDTDGGVVKAVDDVSFDLEPGRRWALSANRVRENP